MANEGRRAMAAAAPASRSRRRAAPRQGSARPAPPRLVLGGNVRWDRLARVGLLIVLGFILLLYVGPIHSYYSTWQQSRARHADLHRLQAENARLRARQAALRNPGTLEREARKLGMVRPGERAYVVDGLPRGG